MDVSLGGMARKLVAAGEEIERLQADRNRLRAAMENVVDLVPLSDERGDLNRRETKFVEAARNALETSYLLP